MIRSMTGFGQGSAEGKDFKIRADVRTVNNRFLDIHMRLPQEISSLEISLKKQIQAALSRGRVDLTIVVEQMRRAEFVLNRPLVSGYLAALADLKNEFGLEGTPSLELVAKLPGAVQVSQDSSNLNESLVEGVSSAVAQALYSLRDMRLAEGQQLAAELTNRLDAIAEQLPGIETEAAKLPSIYRERLARRMLEIQGSVQMDESRIAQEAVLLADRSDISEEIARLKSHVLQVREVVTGDTEVGKRLDFILQEMNREANTILSKSNDLAISDAAIVIKTEVEKLREQVQNVE
ncbi:MAG: YicC family protein [Blastocatellia bacterium AA13]|nr:MAG: YicC family protein [Blastocatellia bacterium AA13]